MKIFISYNRQSRELAKNLAEDLKSLGHAVWFDRELSGGQTWWDQILSEVRACDAFVFLLDPNSLSSVACHSEFGYAAALGKPILPILVTDGVALNLLPPELSRIQYVDYRKPDREAAFNLARALINMPSAPPLPNPLPAAPEVPSSYLGSLTRKIDSTGTISYEEQTGLLVDLRRGLRSGDSGQDARALLLRLRRRRDLFATVAEEIDEMLGGLVKQPLSGGRPALAPTPPPTASVIHEEPRRELLEQVSAALSAAANSTREESQSLAPEPHGVSREELGPWIGGVAGSFGGLVIGANVQYAGQWTILLWSVGGAFVGALIGKILALARR